MAEGGLMKGITTIDELLEKLGGNFEIKVVEDPHPDLSDEQKKNYADYLTKLIQENIDQLGDFSYSVNTKTNKWVSMTIISYFKDTDTIIKNVPIIKNGEKIGSSCFLCSERVRCITKDETPCSMDDKFSKEYFEKLRKNHDLNDFNREAFITILENEGFVQKKFLGIEKMNAWEKERMTVYLP